jgi:tetratricopeptide (TPR) repeat protein
MDSEYFTEAIQWYSLYTKLKNTWIEEVYISYISIAKCLIRLKSSLEEVENVIKKAINTIPDRAEAYYIMGKYYNDNSILEKGYTYLKNAYECNFETVSKKYMLFINETNYGKYVKDELSVSCFWTNRGEEGYKLLNEAIDDIAFIEHKERLLQNKAHFKNKYKF